MTRGGGAGNWEPAPAVNSSQTQPVLASPLSRLLAGGIMATQGLEVWLRARKMLADSIAAKAARTA